jgi:hypothetical protein
MLSRVARIFEQLNNAMRTMTPSEYIGLRPSLQFGFPVASGNCLWNFFWETETRHFSCTSTARHVRPAGEPSLPARLHQVAVLACALDAAI